MTKRCSAMVREIARGGRYRYAVFAGNGRWIAAVDENARATIFEWPSGRQLRMFAAPAHGHGRTAAALTSRDGRYFGWLGEDIQVWDVTEGSEAIEPVSGGSWYDAAAFLDDGRRAPPAEVPRPESRRALKRLVVWRTAERIGVNDALTRRHRVHQLWMALR